MLHGRSALPAHVHILAAPDAMTPDAFIAKWRASELKERSASQEHFIDLCRLLGEPTPAEADPAGEWYCFERGARKDSGAGGWADVWKRGCFAWEYKGKHADLDAAFDQLRQYALALENPPLLIVSDMARFRIRTNWTNSVSKTHEFALDDLADGATRDKLKWAMSDPERLRPGETRQAVTERAAATFAALAQGLRERGHDPQAVAHFVNRLVFCMFAEDVGLLPGNMFTRMLEQARRQPDEFAELAGDLFSAMSTALLSEPHWICWILMWNRRNLMVEESVRETAERIYDELVGRDEELHGVSDKTEAPFDKLGKAERELKVFEEFRKRSGLPIDPESVKNREPPEPDIYCEIEGCGSVAFELSSLINQRLAKTNSEQTKLDTPEPVYLRLDSREAIRCICRKKREKSYSTPHPIELVLYESMRPAPPANFVIQCIRDGFQNGSELGPFRGVWYMGAGGEPCKRILP